MPGPHHPTFCCCSDPSTGAYVIAGAELAVNIIQIVITVRAPGNDTVRQITSILGLRSLRKVMNFAFQAVLIFSGIEVAVAALLLFGICANVGVSQ